MATLASQIPTQALPLTAVKWGLKRLGKTDLNQYAFPDLSEIVQKLGEYVAELSKKPPRPPNTTGQPVAWPGLKLTLKVGQQVTQPGMVLMLGNPEDGAGGAIYCDVMNGLLPGVSYQTIHSQWNGSSLTDGKFVFTNHAGANEFFLKTGAIAIMPSDAAWAGNSPATQLTHGGVMVNAHSGCVPGLMVHEIVHCYGGPAGFTGEGLTDWFAIDFMKSWGKTYDGNPAYAYQTSLIDRLAKLAGKERVARLAFAAEGDVKAMKGSITGGKMPISVTGTAMLGKLALLGDKAYEARAATMKSQGLGEDVVPVPASEGDENTQGVPGMIETVAKQLIALMPL